MLVEGSDDARYVVVFDPLDGSSNIDASIPTGRAVVPPPTFTFASLSGKHIPESANRWVLYDVCSGLQKGR